MISRDKVFIIAEAGVNHNGSLDMAKQLIDIAATAGADAVKFQTFKADQLASSDAPKADYQKKHTHAQDSQLAMLKKLELSFQDHKVLVDHCNSRNIQFLSTPFDHDSANFLIHDLALPLIKISSGELTTAPLLLHIAKTKRPVILSTGMAALADIELALGVLAFGYLDKENPSAEAFLKAYVSAEGQKIIKEKVTLLHCTSSYPANIADIHLKAMNTLRAAFGLSVGYSDHSMGIHIPIAAVAKGACIIEKHFTLDRTLPGPDHQASLEPNELNNMVHAIREVELALGRQEKFPTEAEFSMRSIARKSLVATRSIKAGELFCHENLGCMRPGNGIEPVQYWSKLQTTARKNYQVGELIDE